MYLAARVTKNINFSQFQTLPSIVEIVALLVPTCTPSCLQSTSRWYSIEIQYKYTELQI